MADEVIEIEDIVDEDSLKQWLTDWPVSQGLDEKAARQIAVTIAHRTAMRIMPIWWEYSLSEDARKRDLTALHVLRSSVFSGVAGKNPTPRFMEISYNAYTSMVDANTAFAAHEDAFKAASHAADVVDYASSSVIYDATTDAVAAATSAATAYAAVADYYYGADAYIVESWKTIQADCRKISVGVNVFATRLWTDQGNPLEGVWSSIKTQATEPEWAFWIKWYDDALAGRAPDWDLLEKIALIDSKVWDAGPVAVAAEIEKIELRFAIHATPNAEEIIINDDGLYQAISRSTLPARTLQDSKDRIGDVVAQIRDAQQSSNQYSALVPEAELLERVLERYGDNALRLHEVCHKVVRHTAVYVADGVLPENDNLVGDVSSELLNSADDIYNFDDEVKETIDARAKLRFERLTKNEKSNVVALAEAVAEHSVELFAEELREDAQALTDEGEPTEDEKGSRYRLTSRLVRVYALGGEFLINVRDALLLVGGLSGGVVVCWQIIRALIGFLI